MHHLAICFLAQGIQLKQARGLLNAFCILALPQVTVDQAVERLNHAETQPFALQQSPVFEGLTIDIEPVEKIALVKRNRVFKLLEIGIAMIQLVFKRGCIHPPVGLRTH